MLRYVFKRLLMMIPVIIGISFLLFAVMNLTPGDPARLILGEYALQSDVDKLREEMGLNENFFVRYGNYMKDAVRGGLRRIVHDGFAGIGSSAFQDFQQL